MWTGCGWEIMVDHKFRRGRGRCQLSLERTAADRLVFPPPLSELGFALPGRLYVTPTSSLAQEGSPGAGF